MFPLLLIALVVLALAYNEWDMRRAKKWRDRNARRK